LSVSSPPRPTHPSAPSGRDEFDAIVEALIEEARQRARRRRRTFAAVAALGVLLGGAIFAVFDHAALSQTAAPARTVAGLAAGSGGAKIAFISTSRRFGPQADSELFAIAADGSGRQRLSHNAWLDTPAWSPDGRRIAFVSRHGGNTDVYVMNADGSSQRNLTRNQADDSGPVWSPDGRKVAFVRGHVGNDRWRYSSEIYVMNADGGAQRRLTENPAPDIAPAWSSDGRMIAFLRERDFGKYDVVAMNADGSGQHRLAHYSSDGTPAWSPDPPVWSPDGQAIAFVSHRDGVDEVYVVSPGAGGKRNLTRSPARDFAPAWSPDGSKMVFVRVRGGNPEVYVMNADGSAQRRLARHGTQPVWSPDGTAIAFVRARSGNQEVVVMNADGSDQRMLTRRPATDDHSVSWAPAPTR
jgi:TolB protein